VADQQVKQFLEMLKNVSAFFGASPNQLLIRRLGVEEPLKRQLFQIAHM